MASAQLRKWSSTVYVTRCKRYAPRKFRPALCLDKQTTHNFTIMKRTESEGCAASARAAEDTNNAVVARIGCSLS